MKTQLLVDAKILKRILGQEGWRKLVLRGGIDEVYKDGVKTPSLWTTKPAKKNR